MQWVPRPRTVSLPPTDGQVLGTNLNCSESSRGSGLRAQWFTSPPQCHLQAARSHSLRPPHAPTALASKGLGAASLLMVDYEPSATGSVASVNTIGMSAVASLAGFAAAGPSTTITSTFKRTSSAASSPTRCQPGSAEQDRLSAHAPSRTTSAPCAPVPCQFQLSGRNLDQAAEGYRQ